jgi:uncharacterized protein (TIGR02217 family)
VGFHDIRFPTSVDWGSSGGPGSSVGIITMDSGQERRIVRWEQFRHRYDVGWQVKKYVDLADLKEFYLARNGLEHSFRYKDWLDYNSTALGKNWDGDSSPPTDTDQQIGVGDGATTTFQLVKRYTDSGGSYVRTITKPVADTVVVSIDDVAQASGWTVNTSTGVVTFTVAPAIAEVVKAGFDFDVEVRFGDGVSEYFSASADDFGSGSVPNLPLIEVLGTTPVSEDMHYGGAKTITYSANITLDMSSIWWTLSPNLIELKAFLPDIATVPSGGPIFVLRNTAGPSVFVRDFADTTDVIVLATNRTALIYSGLNSSGVATWYVLDFAT